VGRASGPWSDGEHRTLSLLARSPHETVRAWAAQDLDLAPDPAATTIAGRLAARRLLAQDRRAFLETLRAALTNEDQAPQALAQVRALGLAAELEPELLDLARPGRSPRLLATAIAALGEARRESAVAAAAPLLEHGNDRVRANAVETIGHAGPAANLHAIIELKADPHHRVRANATRAEFLAAIAARSPEPDLHQELTRMLTDTRAMHRLAGLWLAGRTLPLKLRAGEVKPELAARIAEAARVDDDPRVRVRAAACSQRLGAELRLIWRNSRSEAGAA
jgi:HEAT repeat protein